MSEPRTTDYCARCGQSPDSGTHVIRQPGGHDYVPPGTPARPPVKLKSLQQYDFTWEEIERLLVTFLVTDDATRMRLGLRGLAPESVEREIHAWGVKLIVRDERTVKP